LASDKVFFHFFENILNGHRRTFVSPQLRFMPFYRIPQRLPSKKNKKMRGDYSANFAKRADRIASHSAAALVSSHQIQPRPHVYRFD
jgi:hypothetical protein